MKKRILLLLLLFSKSGVAQEHVSIQIHVLSDISKRPIPNCIIQLLPIDSTRLTDSTGKAIFTNIPSGRYHCFVQKEGFKSVITETILIQSQKATFYTLFLTENAVQLPTLLVTSTPLLVSNESTNPLAYVSSRSFTAEETDRIPVGLQDPARAALSYSGVQGGRNDLENPIIVRGNSPFGVSWRIEGIDVPNPNHFAKHGAAGGGLSVFSAQVIGRSDFFSGAMPAEFGNALSASFDIKLREGDKQNVHSTMRTSVLGIDIGAEGPIKKNKSSFLVNYRYSTLGLLNWITFYLADTRKINTFSDFSFHLVSHARSGNSQTAIFGVTGKSFDRAYPEENTENRRVGEIDDWEDRTRLSNVSVLGLTHRRTLSTRSSVHAVLAYTRSDIRRWSDTLSATNDRFRYNVENYVDTRLVSNVAVLYKLNSIFKLKAGIQTQFIFFDFFKNVYPKRALDNEQIRTNGLLIWANGKGQTLVSNMYFTTESVLFKKLYLSAGLHHQFFFFNQKGSLEPRFAFKFSPTSRQIVAVSWGIHSQILPLSTYFVTKRDEKEKGIISYTYPNRSLAFPRSEHLVLSYRFMLPKQFKLSFEAYQQNLQRVLVQTDVKSSYWMLNYADGYPEVTNLEASGKGMNRGLDITLEKLFYEKYFLIFTGSLNAAKFQTFAGDWFHSAFSDRFGSAWTAGREFSRKQGRVLQTGLRFLYNGGFRYTEPDVLLSNLYGSYYPDYYKTNVSYVPAYRRIDMRISYRFQTQKSSGQFALDIQNLTNYANFSRVTYNFVRQEIDFQRKGTGLTPILSFTYQF